MYTYRFEQLLKATAKAFYPNHVPSLALAYHRLLQKFEQLTDEDSMLSSMRKQMQYETAFIEVRRLLKTVFISGQDIYLTNASTEVLQSVQQIVATLNNEYFFDKPKLDSFIDAGIVYFCPDYKE